MATSKSRSFCTTGRSSFRCPASPGHGHPEVRFGSDGCDERSGLRTQLHAELDTDLIWRVVDRLEPGEQATGRGGHCRSGVLKCLISLLHEGGVILPEPAHRRTGGRLVGLNQNAAALVKWKFDETLHQATNHNILPRAR